MGFTMDIRNLNKSYANLKALDSVTIEKIKGVHGLVGENGAGKTTLLRILATILEKDSGSITHGELNWENSESVRRKIGYLPQKFGMYHQLTVREVLEHMAILKEISGDIKTEVENAIHLVNLDEKKDTKVGALSGGMIRRLGIAQAILGNPEIIIVDEPTSGLDPEERLRFRLLLRELGNQRTILFSTHIIDDADSICDRITVLHKGHVMMTGTCLDIIENATGKVWLVIANEMQTLESVVKQKNVYITEQKKSQDKYSVRMISDKKPCEGAISATPTLEEGYLFLIHGV